MYTLLYGLYKCLVQKDEYFVLILGLDNAGKTTYLEAAKTKFTKSYKGINPNKITTTVGLNIGKIDITGVRLNFWDLGGQEELQSLWDKYYAESHAVIYIVDSSDRDRIPDSKETFVTKEMELFRRLWGSKSDDIDEGMIVGRMIMGKCSVCVTKTNNTNYFCHLKGPKFSYIARPRWKHHTFDEKRKCSGDRMISSEHLMGVPLLVLANKQDIPDCMGVREVKPIFNQSAHLIGRRDCMVMPVSALNGDGVDEGIHWLVDCVKRNSDIRPPRNQEDNCLS